MASDASPDQAKAAGEDASATDGADVESALSDLVKTALTSLPAVATAQGSLNPIAFTLGIAVIFLLSRAASYLTPFKLYFSFQSFLFSTDDQLKWTSLGIKLAIPALVGFCLFYLPFRWLSLSTTKHPFLALYLQYQADLTARCSAFFAALLMAWPFIIYWDLMAPPNLYDHRIAFYFIYLLYFISYSYFASLGVLIAKSVAGETLSKLEKLEISKAINVMEAVRKSAMGVLTSAFATYLSTYLAGAS